MAYSKREREDYNRHREHVGKELGLDKNKYNALRRVAHGLTRADTDSANGTRNGEPTRYQGNKLVNEYTEKHYNKDRASHFKKAEVLRKKLGGKDKIHFYHQSDPRGASLYVGKDRMSHKDYNSKGHVIY